MVRIETLIKAPSMTPQSERAEWQGLTNGAAFQAAKVRDAQRTFGKRKAK